MDRRILAGNTGMSDDGLIQALVLALFFSPEPLLDERRAQGTVWRMRLAAAEQDWTVSSSLAASKRSLYNQQAVPIQRVDIRLVGGEEASAKGGRLSTQCQRGDEPAPVGKAP